MPGINLSENALFIEMPAEKYMNAVMQQTLDIRKNS